MLGRLALLDAALATQVSQTAPTLSERSGHDQQAGSACDFLSGQALAGH
jgi:hypothetical protein